MIPPNKSEATPNKSNNASVLRIEFSPSTIFLIVIVIASLWILSRLLSVILVLIMALIIVEALIPVIKWFEDHHIPRNIAIGIVFLALLIITVIFITLTVPDILNQIKTVLEQIPVLQAKLVNYLSHSTLTAPLAESLGKMKYDSIVLSSAVVAWEFTTNVAEIFAYTLITIFLALYIMIDRDRLRGGLFSIVPRSYHIRLSRVMLNLETIVGGYIRGQIATSFLMATFIFIILTSVGVKPALALALFGGAADVLPYIGIFLTMGTVILSVVSKSTVVIIIVSLLMLAYEEFEGRILIPVIYGKALRLPSSVILFALLSGAALMGIVGAFLALPIAAVIRMVIVELRIDLPGRTEQSGDAELKRIDDLDEQEYESRTEGMPVEQAAAIAVKMSDERKKDEDGYVSIEKKDEDLNSINSDNLKY